jgi:hypothetical protein
LPGASSLCSSGVFLPLPPSLFITGSTTSSSHFSVSRLHVLFSPGRLDYDRYPCRRRRRRSLRLWIWRNCRENKSETKVVIVYRTL